MRVMIAAACLAASPAVAESYAKHAGVTLFTDRPCTEAVGAIDAPLDGVKQAMTMGMAWGFVLGADTALGGLADGGESTLARLRKACADSPKAPAMDLLRELGG